MRIKPDRKTAGVVVNGTFPPAAAIPETLADMGMLDPQTARTAAVHYQHPDFASFTAAGVSVEVLPGHLSAASSRPPYRPVPDFVSRLIEGLPDVRTGGLRFERTIDFPVPRPTDWERMAKALVDSGWFRCGGDRIGTMWLERSKPAGGAVAVSACPYERRHDAGGTGIRIDVRDSYHGGDADGSTERLLEILATEFAGAVEHSDKIVDGLMQVAA